MFYVSTCYVVSALLMPVRLLLGKLLDLPRWDWLHRFLRLLGTCSLEIYLLNVLITRGFDSLAPWLNHDGRYVSYYAIVYALNILLGVLLHKGIEAVRAAVKGRRSRDQTMPNGKERNAEGD